MSYDEEREPNEPMDESNFLEEMRALYAEDPGEAIARLEDAGLSVEDLDL